MDSPFSTPLFDMFRRGEVAHDIRMLAAQGVLAPRATEQLALLVLLCGDADPGIRAAAGATVSRIPGALLATFVRRPDVAEDVRTFFAARGVVAVAGGDDERDSPLVTAPELDNGSSADDVEPEEGDSGQAPEAAEAADARRMATVQRLSLLNVTGKVKAAMRGTREERGILIRDPNKLVSIAVLSSPKLTVQEVENFSRLGSVSEEVLRVIGTTRAWVKNYGVIRGLCFNPKTPIGLSLGFLKRLLERDIKHVATDRNIPDPVKLAARKILMADQSRRG
jgi:hypothetical protein